MPYLGVDHVDVRVPSLASVERFYDRFFAALGLLRKRYAFVDASGDWHDADEAHPYNTVEYGEELVPGKPDAFIGIIEDPHMVPTRTRLAFRVESKAEVVRWRERLRELGIAQIETEPDFDAYPALFFCDPAGTHLEVCARNPKS